MRDTENQLNGIRRSRRNLIKVVAIASSAILASTQTKLAQARQGNYGQGNNGQGSIWHRGSTNCFLRGTTIRTVDGSRKIEDLTIGDPLPTVFGGTSPIQWIARYLFTKSDGTEVWVKDILPVRIARSALGPDIPNADLFVTKAHSLLIDDVLVPVCNLINHTTIMEYDAQAVDELEFFHIKLEAHDVIYAEGAPCETLLDVDERATNFTEYLQQYGSPPSQNTPCAPVFGFGRRIEIASRLRSAISPLFDRRQKLDIIRDKLEEGEVALLSSPEFAS